MAALAATAGLACGGLRNQVANDSSAWLTGGVRVTGSTPREQVIIQPDSAGDPLEVVGEYRAELIRLTGAQVRARGVVRDDGRFEVSEYEILEIAGGVPIVGTLASEDGDLVIRSESAEPLRLRDAPDRLRAEIGSLVWVLVDPNGRVTGYGVIRQR